MVQSLDDARRRNRSGSTGRVPPHNLQAEESLLGAMLLSRDAIASAVEMCGVDDFYKPAHGHVFDAICSLYAQGEPADPVTVADELRRADLLDAIGGTGILISLQANTPATANAGRYARIVEEHALLRRLIGVAGEIAEIGYGMPDDVAQAVDRAETMVFEVAERRVTDTLRPLHDLLSESLDRLEALYDRGEAITGVPTGFIDLDERLSGLQPSNLLIVGARPSMGKTALALGMAAHAAMEARTPVLFFSLEMSHSEVTQRLLCSEARVDSSRIRNGRLLEADWPKISHAIGRLGEAPLYIDDNPNLTVMEVRAKARRLRSRLGKLGLIIVDYLQLMSGRHSAENRQVEVSEISRGLKILARELEVPVVALSQLSRNLEMRADKRPVLADLRESGCLTAATTVLRCDSGAAVSLGQLLLDGEHDIPVWTLDDSLRMVPGVMSHVFPTGIKPVFLLQLASGRRVEASANHPFLTLDGWTRVDELEVGGRIAVPRRIPAPQSLIRWPQSRVVALARVLAEGEVGFGLEGLGVSELYVPPEAFCLTDAQTALLLGQLWRTDDTPGVGASVVGTGYQSPSRVLLDDVQRLLLRFEIQSRVSVVKAESDGHYRLVVTGLDSQRTFARLIGVHGSSGVSPPVFELADELSDADTVPEAIWRRLPESVVRAPTRPASRTDLAQVAVALDDDNLRRIATSDIAWDRITAIIALGPQPVYDATVAGTHNFVANGITVENSLEQDADVVMFLYRDEVYNPESPDRGTAEVIVSKHRNGPTGITQLAFLDHYTRFANMARV